MAKPYAYLLLALLGMAAAATPHAAEHRRESLCKTAPLAPSAGPVIEVATAAELNAAVQRANGQPGTTIVLADGEYRLGRALHIRGAGVTVHGRSGNRDRVLLRGHGMDSDMGHVFLVWGDDFTLADLTAGWVRHHVVQVAGERGVRNFHARNVRFVNAREQLLKVSYDRSTPSVRAVGGLVEQALFEYPAGQTAQQYAGGISALGTRDWTVRHSVFRNIRWPGGATGPAILFWHDSANTRLVGNVVANSDRGLQLGLGAGGHGPALVANNMIDVTTDVGIGLERAHGITVAHNAVFTHGYPNAIEYRFAQSVDNRIVNNVTNARIQRRDGGNAELQNNVTFASAEWFVAPGAGDFRPTGGIPNLVDRALPVPAVADDAHCRRRPLGAGPDVGPVEFAGDPDPALGRPQPGALASGYDAVAREIGWLTAGAATRVQTLWSTTPGWVLVVAASEGLQWLVILALVLVVRRALRRIG